MTAIASNVRFAFRLFARQPGFTATAILVLALGIGANAAVFSVINTLLLRPLPGVRDARAVVGIYSRHTAQAGNYRGASYPDYVDIREGTQAFDGVSAFTFALAGLQEGDLTRRGLVLAVSANYFETLGAMPARGRAFTIAEERPGIPVQVAVASHTWWQQHGSDPALIGRPVSINGRPFTVVGIAPAGFAGTATGFAPEFWIPLGAAGLIENDLLRDIGSGDLASRSTHELLLFGRLKPGVATSVATSDLAALAARLVEQYPASNRGFTFIASPLQRKGLATVPGDDDPLYPLSVVLLAMSGVVLLVACLNLSNMLLARGTARRKEMAIRLSIGAGRSTIVGQLLTEGFLLSLAGGAVGLTLGRWAMALLVRSIAPVIPMPFDVSLVVDWRMTVATMVFATLATVVFGLGPALKAARVSVVEELKEQAGEGRGRRAWRFGARNLLLAAQVALSLVLLATGGLFVRGAFEAANATPGFSPERGMLVEADPSLSGLSLDESAGAHRRAVARLRQVPGVDAVSMASQVPFGTNREQDWLERADGRGPDAGAPTRRLTAEHVSVGTDYFRSLGLRVLAGREFTADEAEGREPRRVAIIDEPAARRLFPTPGENPVGRFVRVRSTDQGPLPEPLEIVGVVPGVRASLFDRAPSPHVYEPFASRVRAAMCYHVRMASGGPAEGAAAGMLRRELTTLDARLPVLSVQTLGSFMRRSVFLWLFRSGARIFTAFGLAALALALAGIYGVTAYLVARRTREFGIRMALGATPREVVRLVIRETAVVTTVGVVVGTLLAAAVARLLGSMLYEVTASDPVALLGAPVLLAVSALAAAYLPARRATRVSVVSALRGD